MKIAFVTGSSIGIGAETAKLFAKNGYNIVATYYKDKENGEDTARECRKLGAEVLLLKLNVMDDDSIKPPLDKPEG
jgi:3-oxoacyl-[acyl-carrier protein] reductase